MCELIYRKLRGLGGSGPSGAPRLNREKSPGARITVRLPCPGLLGRKWEKVLGAMDVSRGLTLQD